MRRRCKFELQFTDLAGVVPPDASCGAPRLVRVTITQRDGKKRYASTAPLSLVAGTSSPPQSVAWECSVRPGKVRV